MNLKSKFSAMTAAILASILVAASMDSRALGQSTQPSVDSSGLLGPLFTSKTYSIQFCPPTGAEQVEQFDPEVIATFDRPDYDWHFRVWRVVLDRSQSLSIHKDETGMPQDGVLEGTLASLQDSLPKSRVLRNEVINVRNISVGMITLRYETATNDRRLLQQALIQAPDADQKLYYCLELNSPGKPLNEPDAAENPGEKLAYQTFAAITDSVQLLDFKDVLEDQLERLNAAHALELNWPANRYQKIRDAIVPEQWLRVVRDGDNVGYTYVFQEIIDNGKDGDGSTLRVGVRTRIVPAPGVQWDTGTWYKSTLDRRHENWTFEAKATDPKHALLDSYTQIGTSDEQTKVVTVHPRDNKGQQNFAKQGVPEIDQVRNLHVAATHGVDSLTPIDQETPQFYLSGNFAYMLPHILPLNVPCGYMWAVFVAQTPTAAEIARKGGVGGHVLSRYVDVKPVADVDFDGKTVHAVVVTDRITLDGPVTKSFLTPEGKFLGSSTTSKIKGQDSTVLVLPSDAPTIQRIWPDSELTQPRELPPQTGPDVAK